MRAALGDPADLEFPHVAALGLDGVAEHCPHAANLRAAAQREGLVVEAASSA